jgi:hypothetical protein
MFAKVPEVSNFMVYFDLRAGMTCVVIAQIAMSIFSAVQFRDQNEISYSIWAMMGVSVLFAVVGLKGACMEVRSPYAAIHNYLNAYSLFLAFVMVFQTVAYAIMAIGFMRPACYDQAEEDSPPKPLVTNTTRAFTLGNWQANVDKLGNQCFQDQLFLMIIAYLIMTSILFYFLVVVTSYEKSLPDDDTPDFENPFKEKGIKLGVCQEPAPVVPEANDAVVVHHFGDEAEQNATGHDAEGNLLEDDEKKKDKDADSETKPEEDEKHQEPEKEKAESQEEKEGLLLDKGVDLPKEVAIEMAEVQAKQPSL